MRQLSDTLLARIKSGVVVIGRSRRQSVADRAHVGRSHKKRFRPGWSLKSWHPLLAAKVAAKPTWPKAAAINQKNSRKLSKQAMV